MQFVAIFAGMLGIGMFAAFMVAILWVVFKIFFFVGAAFAVICTINLILFGVTAKRRESQGVPISKKRWKLNIIMAVVGIALIQPSLVLDLALRSANPAPNLSVPLSMAAASQDETLVIALLKNGADPNKRENGGITPLMVAQGAEVAQALINHGADVNAVDDEGRTALHHALEKGVPVKTIECLLKNGADANATDPSTGNAPLLTACGDLNYSAVSYLLDHGADVNCRNTAGETPLHLMTSRPDIEENRYSTAMLLIRRGANPDLTDALGRTPLYGSIRLVDDIKLAELLLENGADPNPSGDFCPLEEAVAAKNFPLAELLLSYEADIRALGADAQGTLVQYLKNKQETIKSNPQSDGT